VVTEHNGDVLRFAGDAILCAWSIAEGEDGRPSPDLGAAALAACRCALALLGSATRYYEITELDATLTIHSGGMPRSCSHAFPLLDAAIPPRLDSAHPPAGMKPASRSLPAVEQMWALSLRRTNRHASLASRAQLA
jgi:hypothetical protein